LRQQARAGRNSGCLGVGVCAANEDPNNVVEGSSEHVGVRKQDHRRTSEPPTSGSETKMDVPEADEDKRNSKNAQVVAEKNATPRESGRDLGNAKRRRPPRSVQHDQVSGCQDGRCPDADKTSEPEEI